MSDEALLSAIDADDAAAVKALVTKATVDRLLDDGPFPGSPPLLAALLDGKYAAAAALVDAGADLEVRNDDGDTPLLAVLAHPGEGVKAAHWLLDRGADHRAQEAEFLHDSV
jgi:ankyrin repeat protein